MSRILFQLLLVASFSAIAIVSFASQRLHDDPVLYSQMNHGGVGLLQTPTSRTMREGDLTIGYKDNDQYRFWTASLQLFPWMETTVRYTDFRNLLYSADPNFSGDQTAKDKGIDVKFTLLDESKYIPQVGLGFRDFGGTGFFESEFISASKRFGDFDVHLGIGFGYLGSAGTVSNPFCDVSESFCIRDEFDGPEIDEGGQIEFQDFFNGKASVIGGVEYQSPWEPLRITVEYEGNNYRNERAGPLVQDSRWNFGLNYRYNDFDFSLSYERGNTFGFGVNYVFNLHDAKQVKVKPKVTQLKDRMPDISKEEVDSVSLLSKVSQSGILLSSVRLEDDKYIVYGTRNRYRSHDEALERIGREMAAHLPDAVKTYHIVETTAGMPVVETVIDAEQFIKIANFETLEDDLSVTYRRQEPSQEIVDKYSAPEGIGFYGDVSTFWTQSFGNPEAFYMYQGGLFASGGYGFGSNISLNSTVRINLLDNFDKFNFSVDQSDSPVPRVRTFVREYVQKSDVSVDTLFVHWMDKISDNLYVQAYGGYLETMYGGVGAEIFHQALDSNVGFGLDLNYVKQRSFENDYAFRDYEAFTGHASVYWKPPFWKDVQLTINAGQFLAKDLGVNFEFARRFDSGVVVGAYATLTEISAQDYGEGSFTKGFYISIPFDLFSLTSSKSRGRIPWVPIARDGGQPLHRPISLRQITSSKSRFVD